MEYILVSEDVINTFVTTIQKQCGISNPIKISHIPELLEKYKSNKTNFIDSYLNGFSIDTKALAALTYIRPYAFYAYGASIYADFTSVKEVGEYAFYKCSKPLALGFPVLNKIGTCAFLDCPSLSSLRLPEIQYIGSSAFQNCVSLSSVYITTRAVPTLVNSNAFSGTPIASTGSIFVEESMVSAFKSANQWSFYSNHITKV